MDNEILDYKDLAAIPKVKAIYDIERPDLITYEPFYASGYDDKQEKKKKEEEEERGRRKKKEEEGRRRKRRWWFESSKGTGGGLPTFHVALQTLVLTLPRTQLHLNPARYLSIFPINSSHCPSQLELAFCYVQPRES